MRVEFVAFSEAAKAFSDDAAEPPRMFKRRVCGDALRDCWMRVSFMLNLSLQLAAVLDELPVAVALVSRKGRVVSKTGSKMGLVGEYVPSFDRRESGRWSFRDASGSAIPPADWPSGRALRGERHYDGMVGAFIDGEVQKVKIISMPVFDPLNEVGAISFLQALDAKGRSAAGSHHDLQERLIDELAKAVDLASVREALINPCKP